MSKRTQQILIGVVSTIVAIVVIGLVVILATGKPEVKPGPLPTSSASIPVATPTTETPVFDGTWKSDDPSANFVATVKGDVITIVWNMDEKTHGLYWKGTFPLEDTDGTIVSQADKAALSKSLVASQDSTKEFSFHDNRLTFDFGALGVTRTIHLTK